MSAEQRPMNRGARGWEMPPVFKAPKMSADELTAMLRDAGPGYIELWPNETTMDHVIDLIPVNGVWMTPEDARKT